MRAKNLTQALKLERAKELFDAGLLRQALRRLVGRWSREWAGEAGFLKAEILRSQGLFPQAVGHYLAVLEKKRSLDADSYLEACLGLAAVYRSLGAARKARYWLKQGRPLARRRFGGAYAERWDLEEALVLRAEGRYQESLRRLIPLRRALLSRKDWQAGGFVSWAIAGARRFSGDLAKAMAEYARARALARRAKDSAGEAYALFGLGGSARMRGELEASRRFYSQAGALLKDDDDLFGRAYAHCGLANALRQLGRNNEALRHYRISHRLYSALGDTVDLAYVNWGLGKLALQGGRWREAKSRLIGALRAFEKGREARGIVLSRLALAALFHARGRTSRAQKIFDSGLRLSRKTGLRAHLEIFT